MPLLLHVSIMAMILAADPFHGGFLAKYDFAVTATSQAVDGPEAALDCRQEVSRHRRGKVLTNRCADEQLTFEWIVNDYEIAFALENRGAEPVRLDPAAATFAPDGEAAEQALLTEDKPRLVAPRAIRPGKAIDIVDVHPSSHVKVSPDGHIRSLRTLFVPPGYAVGKTPEEIIELAKPNVGATFVVRFGVLQGEERRIYAFHFRVTGVRARSFRDTF